MRIFTRERQALTWLNPDVPKGYEQGHASLAALYAIRRKGWAESMVTNTGRVLWQLTPTGILIRQQLVEAFTVAQHAALAAQNIRDKMGEKGRKRGPRKARAPA